jgi:DNA gyrase subunit B
MRPQMSRGNTFTFRPDFTIMDHVDFDAEGIVERGKVLAATFPGLQVTVTDQRGDEAITTTLHAPNGMTDYLAQWVMPNDAVGEIQVASGSYPIADKGPTVDVQVALQWRETMATEIIAFASGFETPDHGTHVNGFKRWLDEQNDIQPLGANGYTAVVSVIHPDPQFESQTRIKLMNLEAADAVYSVLSDQLGKGSA